MKKAAVALSGGVDSAAAALMLLNEGYEVCGITYKLLENQDIDINDAKKVCASLNIDHMVFDYSASFTKNVINPFISYYLEAKTPNPCIFCNKTIKFGEFYKDCMEKGFDYIATGHYAKIEKDQMGFHLLKAPNEDKDQSYVLYGLNQEKMQHVLFPLGKWNYSKDKLRQMIKEAGIPCANRPDSQDICFIKDGDYASYIEKCRTVEKKGNFIDESGKILGKHNGSYRYTVGQRKGLGISLGAPAFVTNINPETGDITLSLNEQKLITDEFYVEDYNFCAPVPPAFPLQCEVKMRYKAKPQAAVLTNENSRLKLSLAAGGRAPTPGQSAVFYVGNEVIGGGIIINRP